MTRTVASRDRVDLTLYDYGVGNLHSIKKALERSGARIQVTQDPHELLRAEAIVLPGVGAFGASMRTLQTVRDPLRERLAEGTPCLAVCIGMQLLFESSEESPGIPGIGLLPGTVRALPPRVGKVPHLGWNTLQSSTSSPSAPATPWNPLLPAVGTYAYFVHSYYVDPRDSIILAATRYGEADQAVEIPAIVAHANTLATQFHPEKSSTPGLRFIQDWVQQVAELGGSSGSTVRSPRKTESLTDHRDRPDPERPEGKH